MEYNNVVWLHSINWKLYPSWVAVAPPPFYPIICSVFPFLSPSLCFLLFPLWDIFFLETSSVFHLPLEKMWHLQKLSPIYVNPRGSAENCSSISCQLLFEGLMMFWPFNTVRRHTSRERKIPPLSRFPLYLKNDDTINDSNDLFILKVNSAFYFISSFWKFLEVV